MQRTFVIAALLLAPAVASADFRERSSFGVGISRHSELHGIVWWLPDCAQSRFRVSPRLDVEVMTSAFGTDSFGDHMARRMLGMTAGMLVRISKSGYVSSGGGVANDSIMHSTGTNFGDVEQLDGTWRPQAYAGIGARWVLTPFVAGAAPPFVGVDVRGIVLFGDGPTVMAAIPEVPRFTVQASMMLGLVL